MKKESKSEKKREKKKITGPRQKYSNYNKSFWTSPGFFLNFEVSDMKFLSLKVSVISPPVHVMLY